MTSLDQLKQTFFEECSENLREIETGLTEIRATGGSDDTINAVFRAVHSVKGGAGIFGFEALVDFAHVFETTLDAVRKGELTAASDVVDILLSSSDVLSDLVGLSRAGDRIDPSLVEECLASLNSLIGGNAAGDAISDEEDFGFVPIKSDAFQESNEPGGPRTFEIRVAPKPGPLGAGGDPSTIFAELRRLGDLDVRVDSSAVPPLEELETDHAYVSWTLVLQTSAPASDVEAAFLFLSDGWEWEVHSEEPAAADAGHIDDAVETPGRAEVLPEPSLQPAPVPVARAATPEKPAAKPGASKRAATTTRIELDRIDRVVNMVGELVISQAMLGQIVQGLPVETSGRLMQVLDEVAHHTRELKDSVMSMRAQPVAAVFERMPRLVRELSTKTSKKVRLETVGETTEVDRSIIERLGEPLTHIIRNAIDHGIEVPEERARVGKPEEGVIRLSAEQRGGRIVIEVSDDGAGINAERVMRRARERQLISADAALTDEEINNLVFMPGFSTAEAVSDISGRGVGMDVVRSNIQDLGGRISLKSERGKGMKIQLALPLTLAVMDGMVVKASEETYVVAMSAIVECLRPSSGDIRSLIGTNGMLRLRGEHVPIAYLTDLFSLRQRAEDAEQVVIITEAGDETRLGIVVDELCGHQQVVIKSIEESYGVVPGVAAATILGNGRVAFILDVEKLPELASGRASASWCATAEDSHRKFASHANGHA